MATDLKDIAITRALQALNNMGHLTVTLGADRTNDPVMLVGEWTAEAAKRVIDALLPVAKVKPPKGPIRKVNNFLKEMDYMTTLRAMKPNDLHEWERPKDWDMPKWRNFGATINSKCRRDWGSDGYVIERTDNTIKLLRVV